jgi:hypothetical protein
LEAIPFLELPASHFEETDGIPSAPQLRPAPSPEFDKPMPELELPEAMTSGVFVLDIALDSWSDDDESSNLSTLDDESWGSSSTTSGEDSAALGELLQKPSHEFVGSLLLSVHRVWA